MDLSDGLWEKLTGHIVQLVTQEERRSLHAFRDTQKPEACTTKRGEGMYEVRRLKIKKGGHTLQILNHAYPWGLPVTVAV